MKRENETLSNLDRRLITLGGLALLVSGLFLAINFVDFETLGKKGEPTPTFDFSGPAGLFAGAQFDVVTVIEVVDNTSQDELSATAGLTGEWEITAAPEDSDTGLGVDHPRLSGVTAGLPGLVPTNTLSNIESMALYGLVNPAYTISFQTNSGAHFTFTVGDASVDGRSYYVQLEDDTSTTYLVPTAVIDPVVDLVVNPPYVPLLEQGPVVSTPAP